MHTTPPRRTGAGRTPSRTSNQTSTDTPGRTPARAVGRVDIVTIALAMAVVSLLVLAGNGRAPSTDAAPPPAGGSSHGAAGSGRNGFGGEIAPSPTMRSWPGTGSGGNGGPFAFIGAHYGPVWQVPASVNNSRGVGYCVMEDVAGEGTVSLQPDPASWDAGEMARAAALMSTFGGDRVVPYGIDASGPYDVATGEWQQPTLLGGGEYTRRRHVAVNFGAKMFVEDVSPSGAVAGLKLARDTAVVNGSGGEFAALRNGYVMARYMARIADAQHAVGGVRLQMLWATPDGRAPASPGTYALEVRAADGTGKPVGHVPVVVLSDVGIDRARTVGATARVDRSGDSADDNARWNAAAALGWPTMDMAGALAADARFGLAGNPNGADVTDAAGIARFDVAITSTTWELAFHTQAPTADVSLYAGTGIQGQITWSGPPQSSSTHVAVAPPLPPPPPPSPPPPPPPSPTPPPPPAAPEDGMFHVRKVLDADDVQGARDMSGFEFEIRNAPNALVARLVTGADGRTPVIEAHPGTYTIAEVARPTWAAPLVDPGPITYELAPGDGAEPHVLDYVNVVPDATIITAARDAHDGDRLVELDAGDATIVDSVAHTALVPGTEYVASGELMVRSTEPAGSDGDTPMIPTGITGSTTFVPDQPDGIVEVTFAIPADSPLRGHVVVVYQRLAVAESGRIVALHNDPDAAEQTIRFADAAPTTTTAVTTTIAVPATTAEPVATVATTTATTTTTTTTAAPATSTSPPSSPPPSPPPTTIPAGPALPRTGSSSVHASALAGAVLVVLGLTLLATVSRRRPPRSTTGVA